MTSKTKRGAVAAALVLGTCGLAVSAFGDTTRNLKPVWGPDVYGGYASTHITVQIRADQVMPVGDAARFGNEVIDAVMTKWNVQSVRPTIPFFGNPGLARKIGLDRYYTLVVPMGTDTPTMAAEFADHRWLFDYAGIDGIGGTADTFPNDPFFNLCYGQHNTGQNVPGSGVGIPGADISCPEAWDIWTGDDSITVAVIDSGVWSHVDLLDNLRLPGYNSVNGSTDVSDTCDHGTHCAGTVAATGNNNMGVAGVSWAAKILPVKVLTGCGGTTGQCAAGIVWATDNGAHIGTMSLQYYTFDPVHRDSCSYAHQNGTLLIAATGNGQGPGTIAYPAKYDFCMGIGATTNRDERASFSNNGPEIDVSAPGQDVYSLSQTTAYRYLSGTSMATPHVAGLAALIWSYAPGMVHDDVERILKETVDDLGTPGFDPLFGHGRVNAFSAIQQADPGLSISGQGQQPTLLPPGVEHVFTVRIREGNDTLVPGSTKLHYRFDGGAYQEAQLVNISGETWEATVPGPSCGTDPEWYVSAAGQTGGVKTLPRLAPAVVWSADVGVIEDFSSFAEGFNAGLPSGWSATGLWNITTQCGGAASCDGGSFAYYGIPAECNYRTGASPNSGTLSSPVIQIPTLPHGGTITMTYCSRKNAEVSNTFDRAWVTFNGVEVDVVPNSTPVSTWNNRQIDLSAFAGQSGRLEFHFDTVDANRNLTLGWQIDGVNIQKYAAYCVDACYADCDNSTGPGVLDIFDFLCFGNSFDQGNPYACDCDTTTGLGVCDVFDFLCFGNAFNAGCP